MEIEFSFSAPDDPARQLSGYRLYQEGTQVCQTDDPNETSELGVYRITCEFLTETGTFDFTLTALYSDGSESPQSPAFPFEIAATTPPDTEPTTSTSPTAIISSSTAADTVPFSVTFDGTSSTTPNTSIESYSWNFGDGSEAVVGDTVSHTYTIAGTYYPQLTVVDNTGLSDTVSTPIVANPNDSNAGNPPPTSTNEQPVAVIETDFATQSDPLAFSFDGSASSDPDGTITEYSWNFGDGTTGSGMLVEHTFAGADIYTVSLTVRDDKGETSTTSTEITCEASFPFNIEVGEVDIDHNWATVSFENGFHRPIVIAGPPSTEGAQPVVVRIRNISQTGFEIRLQEWSYLDGAHRQETLSYMVIEEGNYTLENGSKIEAGYATGVQFFRQVPLKQSYTHTPIIMTQIVTENETDTVTGRVRNIDQNSFEYKLQEMEATIRSHVPETINYIAWEPGKGETAGLVFEIGIAAKEITDKWCDLTFETVFPELPFFFGAMQTCNGSDPSAIRTKDLSQQATKLRINEEISLDAETKHNKEALGYFTIGSIAN